MAKRKIKLKMPRKIKLSRLNLILILIIIGLLIANFIPTLYEISVEGAPPTTAEETEEKAEEGGLFQIPQIFGPKCGNDICEDGESSENCCRDCGCDTGLHCIDNVCKPECGDGICAALESQNTCCLDCGCPVGYNCENNICVESVPNLEGSFTPYREDDSVTIILSLGENNDIGELEIYNSGNDGAKDTELTISSPEDYFDTKIINLGIIEIGERKKIPISLNYKNSILDISDKSKININFDLEYLNSINKEYTSSISGYLEVLGRNSMGREMGAYAAWVTPLHPIIREFGAKSTSGLPAALSGTARDLAARWMFESMVVYGIDYVNDIPTVGDYVQFPYETMQRKNGDCEDLAVLYASLLESIGIESVLVTYPGHMYAGYIDSNGNSVLVETTESNYDDALTTGYNKYLQHKSEITFIKPREYWNNYSQVLYKEHESLPLPNINKQIGSCDVKWNLQYGFYVSTPVTFVNSGSVPGAGCAAVSVYDSAGKEIESDISCWSVNPGQTREVDYIADISISNLLEGSYCSRI